MTCLQKFSNIPRVTQRCCCMLGPYRELYSSSKTQTVHLKLPTAHLVRYNSNPSQGFIPPMPAIVLGTGGLIPFVAPPLFMLYTEQFCSNLEFAHLAYSATIISFLGGVRWGLTLAVGSREQPNWRNLSYSVIPSLLGWSGLLLEAPLGYVPISIGLLTTCIIDVAWAGYPAWHKILRIFLTIGAGASIVLLVKLKLDHNKSLGVEESLSKHKSNAEKGVALIKEKLPLPKKDNSKDE